MAYDFTIGQFINGEGLTHGLDRGVDSVIQSAVRQFMAINRAFTVGGHQLHGGLKWQALAPSTIKRKGHGMVLIDKGLMRASIGFKVIRGTPTRFIVDVGSYDPKSRYHQTGGGRLPKRVVIDITDTDVKGLATDFALWSEKALNGNNFNRLTGTAFAGIDE